MKPIEIAKVAIQNLMSPSKPTKPAKKTLALETLESRELMHGAFLDNGVLHITGTEYDDRFKLVVTSGWELTVTHEALKPAQGPLNELHSDGKFNLVNGSVREIWFYGDKGNDSLVFSSGNPENQFPAFANLAALPPMILDGGEGNDTLNGGNRSDTIFGSDGNDRIRGYGGDDFLYGGDGQDIIRGDSGQFGSYGNDHLCGGDGRDTLRGDNGNDTLYGGGQWNDDVHGGNHNDFVTTGACPPPADLGDFDRDGGADHVVWRPSDGTWYINDFSTGNVTTTQWGLNGDVPVAGDYDGDGTTDLAVWRPNTGVWHIRNSSTGTTQAVQYGLATDIPLPGDYDGDGRTDLAVYRPSDGTWWIRDYLTGRKILTSYQFGMPGDIPVPEDYDNDGDTDLAMYVPGNGTWWVRDATSLTWQTTGQYAGTYDPSDIPVPGDYSRDGLIDFAVWNPTTGVWKIRNSTNDQRYQVQWGLPGDTPQSADFDGDGRADLAVYRPGNGTWYVINSSTGHKDTHGKQWGLPGDWAMYDQTRYAIERIGLGNGLQSVVSGPAIVGARAPITTDEVQPVLTQAIAAWEQFLGSDHDTTAFDEVEVRIADLPTGHLGFAQGGMIYLDSNADGHGWFIDATPDNNVEFRNRTADGLMATRGQARSRIDLLTVLAHELGHVLGYDDESGGGLMNEQLATGTRRLPGLGTDGHRVAAYDDAFLDGLSPLQPDFRFNSVDLFEQRKATDIVGRSLVGRKPIATATDELVGEAKLADGARDPKIATRNAKHRSDDSYEAVYAGIASDIDDLFAGDDWWRHPAR